MCAGSQTLKKYTCCPNLCSLQFEIQLSEIQLRDKDFCKFTVKKVTINKSIEDVLTVDWFKNKIKITISPETNKKR